MRNIYTLEQIWLSPVFPSNYHQRFRSMYTKEYVCTPKSTCANEWFRTYLHDKIIYTCIYSLKDLFGVKICYIDLAFGRQTYLQWVKKLSVKGVALTSYLKNLPINKIPVLMHCQNVLKFLL